MWSASSLPQISRNFRADEEVKSQKSKVWTRARRATVYSLPLAFLFCLLPFYFRLYVGGRFLLLRAAPFAAPRAFDALPDAAARDSAALSCLISRSRAATRSRRRTVSGSA